MPELPEVQTIVDDLNKKILGRRITDVWFDTPKLIKKPAPDEFKRKIKGLKITAVSRRGKNILIYLGDYLLLVHQKMTGHLLVGKWKIAKNKIKSMIKGPLQEKVNDYVRIIFYLDNGQELGLSDLRKFAKIVFGPSKEIESMPDLETIGPDPTKNDFTFEKLKALIHPQKRNIKEVLMDQKLISGIGNIYADEILWLSKINPLKPAKDLSQKNLEAIYSSIKEILSKAVKLRGTSISDFRDTSGKPGFYGKTRYVYRKEGEPCIRCKTPIVRIKIKNRSAHYCPVCQRPKS